MTRPPTTDGDFYGSASWRTPAELDQQRWEWLQGQFLPMGRAFDQILANQRRIEEKLDRLQQSVDTLKPARRRPRIADDSET